MNGHNVTINGWADNIKSGLLSANLINRFDYRGTNSWANDLKNHYLIGTNSRANIDDVNFMIYGGHGFAKNRNQGDGLFANNSLHFGTTNSTAGHPSGNGTGAASNFTTADALYFGYDSSNSKWLLTYSCNFLNTYQGDTNVDHLLDNGGRLILGMASKMFVNPGEATTFANYLVATVNNDPVTISQAFMQAGHDVQDGGWLHINYVPAMMYRILYYGPDDEGTLMDSVVQPLSTIVNTGTKNKDEVINENPIHWIEYN